MKLYSVQPLAVYDQLCSEGVFHSRPQNYPESTLVQWNGEFKFALAYEWLMKQMVARGLERPHADAYPIWAYYRWGGATRPKPDLRYRMMKDWGRYSRQVLVTFEIPTNQVLLSDCGAWHACISYLHGGFVKEANAFYRRFKQAGVDHQWNQPLPEPWHQELLASWERVLDLEACRRSARSKRVDQDIQATVWEVTIDQVVEAVAFGEGRPREKLPLPRRRGAGRGRQAAPRD